MCSKFAGVISHVGLSLGILSMLLAAVARLSCWAPLTLGPRSFAAASALMLLLSIAVNTYKRDGDAPR
ncbi:MAG: hypothetical protein HY748_08455 [Elusimicrobia bacterium]|nr:hypothetical protein [Elusimicrobiota bacterium]